ncbi:unnamed protein product [Caenorhabditis nigoni]
MPYKTGEEFKFRGGNPQFWTSKIPRKDYLKYGIGESVKIEFRVKIDEMIGIEWNPVPDVIVMVDPMKFAVSKSYLSFHSPYFKTLFSENLYGNSDEFEKPIIELKKVYNPMMFEDFLEVLYGAPAQDYNVDGVLKFAEMFDTKAATRRCIEFLRKHSDLSVKKKFEIAVKYKLNEFAIECVSEMKTAEEISAVVPYDVYKLDQKVWAELLKKSLTFAK